MEFHLKSLKSRFSRPGRFGLLISKGILGVLVKIQWNLEKYGNHTFSFISGKAGFSLKVLFSRKYWFSWKWPPKPIETLGNTWYFRHWRKVDFLWEKVAVSRWNMNFPRKYDFSKVFSISVNFPIMPNLQEPEKYDFCIFTKNNHSAKIPEIL